MNTVISFTKNYLGSLSGEATLARSNEVARRYSYYLAFFTILFGALDSFSTEIAITSGAASEANPVMRSLMTLTPDYWIMVKSAIHVVIASMIIWFPSKFSMNVLSVIYAFWALIIANNFSIYLNAI